MSLLVQPSAPHPYDPTGSGGLCAECRLTPAHPVHTDGLRRTRIVLTLDHPADMDAQSVHERLLDGFRFLPDVTVVHMVDVP